MQQIANQSLHVNQMSHQRSRLDSILPQNQQLINNLNRKIDRRLNNGYYFPVATQRKPFIHQPQVKTLTKKLQPKKIHPIIKKVVKPNEQKPIFVEQQQNTDEAQFCQGWQNTSREYVLREPDPILEDEQIQWSYEPTEIQKQNHSMQWSIEPIQQFNEQVQYTLQSQLIIIECQDASIQVDPQPQPAKPLLEDVSMQCQKIKIQSQQIQCQKLQNENQYIQCDKINNEQVQVQYNEPLPQKKQIDLQIDLPDIKQLSKISSMESRLKYLKLQQRKLQKLHKNKQRQVELLKLKQVMQRLQGKVQLAQQKELNLKKRIQNGLMQQQKEAEYSKQKERIKQQAEKQYNKKLQSILSKMKQAPKSKRPINNSFKEQEERRQAQIKKQEQQSKEELINYKRQVQDLKKQLKGQMFKRLNYENQSDQDTATQKNDNLNRSMASRKNPHQISMDSLFPNLKNRYAGAIIKNIPSDINQTSQKKLNQHQESVRLSRAYWKSKSPFNYEYEELNTSRINRKYSYLQKVSQKRIKDIASNPEEGLLNYSPVKSRAKFEIKTKINTNKYDYKKAAYNLEQVQQIKKNIDAFYANQQLFRYLYSQEIKISLGLQLFSILKIKINSMLPQPIQIYKYPNYIVFEYKQHLGIHFILFYHHTKTIIAGKINGQTTNRQFYQQSNCYKNGQIFQYISLSEVYNGHYSHGQRQGFGILFNRSFHYEGSFSLGKKEGKGNLILQNGDKYSGQFKNNHFHGEGIYKWANGQYYDGFFVQGLKHGYGRQYFKNGDAYQGEYKYNKKNGEGIYRWKQGSVYQGQFKNDQKFGQGMLTDKNGSVLVGEWRNDEIFELISKQAKSKSREDLPLTSKMRIQLRE